MPSRVELWLLEELAEDDSTWIDDCVRGGLLTIDQDALRFRHELARVSIETGGKGGAILAVPDAAVQTVEGEPSVFVPVAGEPNTYARRSVKLGRRVGEFVAVESGLREGEPVVVSGSFILKAELGKSEAGHDH